MRALARTAVLAAVAAMLWAVAPALSLSPFAPEPVNFEQRLPAAAELDAAEARRRTAARTPVAGEAEASAGDRGAVERTAGGHDEGRVRYLTAPFAAPARFDLVGLVDEPGPVELRTRERGGRWSPWVETIESEPVWTGGADELQVRSRTRRPRGEVGYVNVSGDATAARGALSGLRRAVNAAFVSAASILAPGRAVAEPPFEVVNRREWDPNERCRAKSPAHGEVRAAVVHHTVNANTYTREQGPAIVLAICRYHRYSQGWNDIGYNALVDRFGNVYAGRVGGLAEPVVGAHTAGFNSQTVGVASIGDHRGAGMTQAALKAAVRFLAWKLPLHGVDAAGKARLVSGGGAGNRFPSGRRVRVPEVTRHRRLNETACPGRAQLKKIAKRTKRRIAASGGAEEPPPPPPPPPSGGGVSFRG